MIVRNNKINKNANEIQLHMSFSKVDVLKWLRLLGNIYNKHDDSRRFFLSMGWEETDVRYFLEHHGQALLCYDARWREQLSAWAWNVAVREKFFVQSSTPGMENKYYPAETLLKKVGRPKKR